MGTDAADEGALIKKNIGIVDVGGTAFDMGADRHHADRYDFGEKAEIFTPGEWLTVRCGANVRGS